MSRFPGSSHEDFERLLAGRGPVGDDALEDVKRFVHDVREAYAGHAVAHSVEAEHLAAMMQAAGPLAHEGGPAVRPTRDGLARQKSGWRSRRRNRVRTPDVKRRLLRSPVGRVAAVLVAMFTIFSGVALAGGLPAPVQKAVSDVAGSVGLDVPSPADDDEIADDDGTGDQVEDADDQGEDEDNDAVAPQPGTDDEQEADDQNEQGDEQEADDQDEQGEDQEADDQGEDADDQGEDADDQGEDEQSGSDEGEESEDHSGPSGSGEYQESDDQGDGHDGDGSRGSDDEGDSHEGSDEGSGGGSGGDQGDDEGEGED